MDTEATAKFIMSRMKLYTRGRRGGYRPYLLFTEVDPAKHTIEKLGEFAEDWNLSGDPKPYPYTTPDGKETIQVFFRVGRNAELKFVLKQCMPYFNERWQEIATAAIELLEWKNHLARWRGQRKRIIMKGRRWKEAQ